MSEDESFESNTEQEAEKEEETAVPVKKRKRVEDKEASATEEKEEKVVKKKKSKPEKVSEENEEGTDDDKDKKAKKKVRPRYGEQNPKMIEMIIEAIEELGDSRGCSVPAIKAFICDHYKVQENMLKHNLKMAFKKGIESKKIARPRSQLEKEKLAIMSGRYVLVKVKAEKPAAPRERPASLRQFKDKGKKAKKGKKKRRRAY